MPTSLLSSQAMVTAHYNPAQWGPVTHDHVSQFIMSHLRYGRLFAWFDGN